MYRLLRREGRATAAGTITITIAISMIRRVADRFGTVILIGANGTAIPRPRGGAASGSIGAIMRTTGGTGAEAEVGAKAAKRPTGTMVGTTSGTGSAHPKVAAEVEYERRTTTEAEAEVANGIGSIRDLTTAATRGDETAMATAGDIPTGTATGTATARVVGIGDGMFCCGVIASNADTVYQAIATPIFFWCAALAFGFCRGARRVVRG
jgi:hypothetical protein